MRGKLRFILSLGVLLASKPAYPQVDLELFAGGFTRPVAIANAGDSRLFVVEQPGIIRIVDSSGTVNPEPFLDITDRVNSAGAEQGLLGLAFHPDFASNGYFYVDYIDSGGGTMISRFWRDPEGMGLADPASEKKVLSFDQPYTNHNGGNLMFGPDGYLYIGTGDGGSAGDPNDNGQNLSVLLGKILRIDVDGGIPYAVPGTNPFKDNPAVRPEIWALGLRNPWRFSFDRQTGDLWIGDVGQSDIEEIDLQPASDTGGANYGWRCYEGDSVYNPQDCPGMENFTFPVHQYPHSPGGNCSVTGGFVYRGQLYPSLSGFYFFTDYCSDRLWSLHDSSGNWILGDHGVFSGNRFSTFGEDRNGELYVAGVSSGKVYRIVDTGTAQTVANLSGGSVRVYPNPVEDQLWIETGRPGQSPVQVRVLDLRGAVVLTRHAGGDPFNIGLGFLAPGMYLLEIQSGNIHEMRKLLKR